MGIGRNVAAVAVDCPLLQYANGKQMAKIGAAQRFGSFAGFHIEMGKDPELDAALRAAGCEGFQIKHQRPGGSEVVGHWLIREPVSYFPLTQGPVANTVFGSLAGENAKLTTQAGIGLRWDKANNRSVMAIWGYLELLIGQGVHQLVQLQVKGRMTDVLLGALLDHVRVCEAADQLVDRGRHPDPVELYEVAMQLKAADEEEQWGREQTTPVTPLASAHPEEVTRDYIRGIWLPKIVHQHVTQDWSLVQQYAAAVSAGAEGAEPDE